MNRGSFWLLLLGTGFTLGLGTPMAKVAAAQGVGALAFTFWSTLVAGVALAALGLLRQGRPSDPPRLARFGGVAGLFGHAFPMSSVFWLSSHVGAGFASLALTLPPVFTLAIGLVLGHDKPTWRRGAAVTLGLTGALLMLAGRGGSFEVTPSTFALALAIPASIGAANVYRARFLPPGTSGEWLSSSMLLGSATVLATVGILTGDAQLAINRVTLFLIAAQTAVLVTGYLLYFALQRRAEPVTFSFIGYVMMATGVGIGTLAFGERLPWTVWPALVLVLAALGLLSAPAPIAVATPAGASGGRAT